MSILGLDIGTTGCKGGAFNSDGKLLAFEYYEYPAISSCDGCAEVDSLSVWKSVQKIIRKISSITQSDPISAICTSAMGEAFVPVSSNRKIIGNSILSSDSRGSNYIDMLRLSISDSDFYNINGNILSPNYTLPKLCWYRDNCKELYAKTWKFLLWDGLVGFMLGCSPFISHSSASRTLLFDRNNKTWSDKLIAISGIDKEKLPVCLESGSIAGIVNKDIAASLGLPQNVKVVVGGHDQCCAALGVGIISSGKAMDGIGTYECLTPVFEKIPDNSKLLNFGLNVEDHVVSGLNVSFIFNQAGSLVRWFRDTFAKEIKNKRNIYDLLSTEMPNGPTSLLILPYFQSTGAPSYISDASGVITGLRVTTRRGEILKAIMESVTFYFTSSLHSLSALGVSVNELIATGGGANSDAWLQMKADILNIPLVRPEIRECGIVGAAILAGKATGELMTYSEAVKAFVKYERTFEPDLNRNLHYRERIEKYHQLFSVLYPVLKQR